MTTMRRRRNTLTTQLNRPLYNRWGERRLNFYGWPTSRPCRSYALGCYVCDRRLFRSILGRFPDQQEQDRLSELTHEFFADMVNDLGMHEAIEDASKQFKLGHHAAVLASRHQPE